MQVEIAAAAAAPIQHGRAVVAVVLQLLDQRLDRCQPGARSQQHDGLLRLAQEEAAEGALHPQDVLVLERAEDGIGDPRRANFWLQYVDSIEKIEFALGARALDERDKDMQVLRTQMLGLTTELRGSDKNNNAFVMSIGNLVAVEFGGMGNAFYGYDRQAGVPFDMTRPVVISKNADNSLKRSERMLWLKHQDGLHGWDKWEDMFAATFKEHFGIVLDNKKQIYVKNLSRPAEVHEAPYEPGQSVSSDFGSEKLQVLVKTKGLTVTDLRGKNGNLWITADASDRDLSQMLIHDGFRYKAGKGWWK